MRQRDSRSGVAAVEAALLLPILVTLMIGVIDFGAALFSEGQIANALATSAEYATLAGQSGVAWTTIAANAKTLARRGFKPCPHRPDRHRRGQQGRFRDLQMLSRQHLGVLRPRPVDLRRWLQPRRVSGCDGAVSFHRAVPRGQLPVRQNVDRQYCGPAAMRTGIQGSVAVEFALVVPPTLMLLFGSMEYGRQLWTWQALQLAGNQTARCVAIGGTVCATASTYAINTAAGFGAPGLLAAGVVIGNPTSVAACIPSGGKSGERAAQPAIHQLGRHARSRAQPDADHHLVLSVGQLIADPGRQSGPSSVPLTPPPPLPNTKTCR